MKLIAILLESQYKANQKLTQKLAEHYIQNYELEPAFKYAENLTQSVINSFTITMKKLDINPNQERWLLTNILEVEKENVRLGKDNQWWRKLFMPRLYYSNGEPLSQEAKFTPYANELFGFDDHPLAESIISHIGLLFANFDKYKNALPDRNIFNYNIPKLVNAATTLAKRYHKDSQTTAEKLGYKRHLETPSFIIDIIDKFETIAGLPESELKTKLTQLSDSTDIAAPFHNTSWCTKYEANFKNYSKGGPFLLVYRKPGFSKYGLLSTKEFKTPENQSIASDKNFNQFLEETMDDELVSEYILKIFSGGGSYEFKNASDEAKSTLGKLSAKYLNNVINNYQNANYTQRKSMADTLLMFYKNTNYSENIKQLIEKIWMLDSGKVPITALLLKNDTKIPIKNVEDIQASTNLQDDIRTTMIMIAQENISDEDLTTIIDLLENPVVEPTLERVIVSLPVEIIEKLTKINIFSKNKKATQHLLANIIARTHPKNTTIALNMIETYAKTYNKTRTIRFIEYTYNSLVKEIAKTPRFEQLTKIYEYLEVYSGVDSPRADYLKLVQMAKQGIMPPKEALDSLLKESLPLALEFSIDYIGPWDDLEEALRKSGKTQLLDRYLEVYTPF